MTFCTEAELLGGIISGVSCTTLPSNSRLVFTKHEMIWEGADPVNYKLKGNEITTEGAPEIIYVTGINKTDLHLETRNPKITMDFTRID